MKPIKKTTGIIESKNPCDTCVFIQYGRCVKLNCDVKDVLICDEYVKAKLLHLTLHKEWFIETFYGRKTSELRQKTPYWTERLTTEIMDTETGDMKTAMKPYTHVQFINGYGGKKPGMILTCESITEAKSVDGNLFKILLGDLCASWNIELLHAKQPDCYLFRENGKTCRHCPAALCLRKDTENIKEYPITYFGLTEVKKNEAKK